MCYEGFWYRDKKLLLPADILIFFNLQHYSTLNLDKSCLHRTG